MAETNASVKVLKLLLSNGDTLYVSLLRWVMFLFRKQRKGITEDKNNMVLKVRKNRRK